MISANVSLEAQKCVKITSNSAAGRSGKGGVFVQHLFQAKEVWGLQVAVRVIRKPRMLQSAVSGATLSDESAHRLKRTALDGWKLSKKKHSQHSLLHCVCAAGETTSPRTPAPPQSPFTPPPFTKPFQQDWVLGGIPEYSVMISWAFDSALLPSAVYVREFRLAAQRTRVSCVFCLQVPPVSRRKQESGCGLSLRNVKQ